MKALLLTNEYPPHIYGGAGIHIEYLSRELAKLCQVDIRCFGDQKINEKSLTVTGYGPMRDKASAPQKLTIAFDAVQRCLDFNKTLVDADIVHCHTWYTHFGGILAKLNYSIPFVLTSHSLEPLRPWKREQLGGGYDFSCWVEKTAIEMADAVIAVSKDAKKDILRFFTIPEEKVHVIYNGIDPDEYRPVKAPEKLTPYGIDLKQPYVLFLGRITKQKGITYLIEAISHMNPDFQVVLCAGAPDTKELADQVHSRITQLQKERKGVIWIQEMLPTNVKAALFSHAALFCCPSIYEPFGIINLEAMACETPVVASAVGGIPEVVEDGKTGVLVSLKQKKTSPFEPLDPKKFSKDLAQAINRLMDNGPLRLKMGKAGRKRAIQIFSWKAIAKKTFDFYQSLVKKS
ncbi:MAG: glycogen synthase [Candidatus Omnitrophica bacterium]|nr:glycogen synthase [Candidatus Omnitrophota bacterium]